MDRQSFMEKLENHLKPLSEDERKEVLYDFHEHFEIGKLEGKGEHDISDELGHPKAIAKDHLTYHHISKAEEQHSISNITRATFSTISLSLLNILFVLGPFLGIAGVYLGLVIASITLTGSPIILLIAASFDTIVSFWPSLFLSLIAAGLGLLLCIAMIHLGRFLYRHLVNYMKFNLSIVKGGRS